jgi:hypothetical protein
VGLFGLLLVLTGPGLLLRPLARRAVELPLFAAAAWIVLFWWLRLVPLRWEISAFGIGVACLGAAVWIARRPLDRGSVLVWVAAAAVAAVLYWSAPVPPGVDGAMHTAVGRVLADAHGHPSGFRPLWPIDAFHSYPVGQPTLTALAMSLGGIDARRAGLFGHAAAYALALVAFAAAVSRWASWSASGLLVGTLAVLCARAPLHFWTWGGAPNALGIAFAIGALAAGVDVLRGDRRSVAVCALFAAASLLTHGVSVAALLWATAPIGVVALAVRRDLRRQAGWVVASGVLAAFLCAPYLVSLRPVLGPRELVWARETMRSAATLAQFPRMLHDVPLVLGSCAALLALWHPTSRARAAFPIALLAALALLVVNGRTSTLPLSVLLYPDRIAVLALYPIALLAHDATALLPRRSMAAVVVAALCAHAAVLQARTVRAGRANALATPDDLRAISEADLAPGCAVLNNYGDAGQWIPALRARPITFPQVNVIFFDEASASVHPCAAFRGEKRPYFVDTVPCPGPACEPGLRIGTAEWFRISDPSLVVHIDPYR